MRQFRFLLVDLSIEKEDVHALRELYGLFKSHCVANLRELANSFAVAPTCRDGSFAFSLLVINPQRAEILLKPQKFSLFNMHKAIDKLERYPLQEHNTAATSECSARDKGWEALQLVHGLVDQLKRNKSKAVKNDFRVNICYLSPRALPSQIGGSSLGEILQSFLEQSVMCSIDFAFVVFRGLSIQDNIGPATDQSDTNDPLTEVNLPLEHFCVFLRDFYHCVVSRVDNDFTALKGLFRRWIVPRPRTVVLQFEDLRRKRSMSPSGTIFCNLHQEIIDDATISSSQMCRCCNKQTEQMDHCKKSKALLGTTDIIPVYSVGRFPTKLLYAETVTTSETIILNVDRRVRLASVSPSLLYGSPYILGNCADESFEWEELSANNDKFQAACQLLLQQESGLLVSTRQNPDLHDSSPVINYFLLLPEDSSSASSFLMRRIAVSEQILPQHNNDISGPIPEECMAKTSEMLNMIPEANYNPLDYEMGFHQRVNGFVQSSLWTSQPEANRGTSTPLRRNLQGTKPSSLKSVLFAATVVPSNRTATPPRKQAQSRRGATRGRGAGRGRGVPTSPFDFIE